MRFAFGGTAADYAITTATVTDATDEARTVAVFEPGVAITFWNAANGGSQYLDLTDTGGAPLTPVLSDDNGWIPELLGPDGVTLMYASAQGGPRVKLLADLTGATGDMNAAIQTAAAAAVEPEAAAREQGDADTLAAAQAYTDTHGGSATTPVFSVNGQTGDVVLDAAAVGARAASDAIPATQVTGLAAVARSGAYTDLTGRPSLAPVASSGAYADLSGKPDVYTKTEADARYAPSVAPSKPATLSQWFRAIDGRDDTGLDVLVVGDSWGEGQGGTHVSDRYLDKLRDLLRAQLNPAGVPGAYGYVPAYYALSGYTQPWTLTGTTLQQNTWGLGRRVLRLSSGATASYTFVGTGAQLYYAVGASASTFSYTIDGGSSSSNVNTAKAEYNQDGSGQTFYGLDQGPHTIQVTANGNYVYLDGILPVNGDHPGTKGVRVWDGSHYGYDTKDFTDAALTAPVSQGWYSMLRNVKANLVMVPLGINDWRHKKVNVSDYKTNLGKLIDMIRLHNPVDCSVMLWAQPKTIDVSGTLDTWANYKQGAVDVAASKGAYLFDASAVTGDYTATSSLWNADGVHPNDAGHTALANALASALLP